MNRRQGWTGGDELSYLIWSHEHSAWWMPERRGYTRRLSLAGRYSRADALLICRRAIPGTADRMCALPELPVALDDVMAMLRDPDGAEYEPGHGEWE